MGDSELNRRIFNQYDQINTEEDIREISNLNVVCLEYFLGSLLICISFSQICELFKYIKQKYRENISSYGLDIYLVSEDTTDHCPICLEEYKREDQLIKLNCDHFFHRQCIYEWFNKNTQKNCPLCRIII